MSLTQLCFIVKTNQHISALTLLKYFSFPSSQATDVAAEMKRKLDKKEKKRKKREKKLEELDTNGDTNAEPEVSLFYFWATHV